MSRTSQLKTYKNHLEKRYRKLLERSSNYQFIDENMSDFAAYKAMKVLNKLNAVQYLEKQFD